MMKRILHWLGVRKATRSLARFNRGYDWTAGELLRGADPDALALLTDSMFDRDEFDMGAEQALRDWATIPLKGGVR